MTSVRLSAVFAWAFGASVVPMFVLVRYGQSHWGFDNIGVWYTVYCAIGFAIAFALAALGLAVALRALRKSHTAQRQG